jgi:hypothetical protein
MNKVAVLNDELRRTFSSGKVVMTAGVAALPEEQVTQVFERVRQFDEFTKDNDPYGEHDFGSFEVASQTYFFVTAQDWGLPFGCGKATPRADEELR